jgi:hypothetical protein
MRRVAINAAASPTGVCGVIVTTSLAIHMLTIMRLFGHVPAIQSIAISADPAETRPDFKASTLECIHLDASGMIIVFRPKAARSCMRVEIKIRVMNLNLVFIFGARLKIRDAKLGSRLF